MKQDYQTNKNKPSYFSPSNNSWSTNDFTGLSKIPS